MESSNIKRRGRPRSYDPDTALQAALELFWTQGYAETSLDDLRDATGMNRPSLYAAFGDKKSIYLKALVKFRKRMRYIFAVALTNTEDPVGALTDFYKTGIDIYLSAGGRGCMAISTTSVEAAFDPDMRADLNVSLAELDGGLEQWFEELKQNEMLGPTADPKFLSWHAVSILLSLGIRARAGHSRELLEDMAIKSASAIIDLQPKHT